MTGNLQQHTYTMRYSPINHPPDVATAESTLRSLRDSVLRIDVQLEKLTSADFENKNAYDDWKRRAIKALTQIKKEAEFLEGWLKYENEKNAIRTFTDRIAKLIHDNAHWAERYQDQTVNHATTQDQFKAISELRENIMSEYVALKNQGKAAGITKREAGEHLRPVVALLDAIENKRRPIRNVLFSSDPEIVTETEAPKTLPTDVQEKVDLLQATVNAIVQERPEISGPNNLPLDSDDADRRYHLVRSFASRVNETLQTIRDIRKTYPQSRTALATIKQPLLALDTSVQEESRYLDEYIKAKRRAAQEEQAAASAARKSEGRQRYEEIQAAHQKVRQRAEELANEIKDLHAPLFLLEHAPASLDEAYGRKALATKAKIQVDSAHTEIANFGFQHHLNREDLQAVRWPLEQIRAMVERELGNAKAYITTHSGQAAAERRRWWLISLMALTRAVNEGFAITDEERKALQKLSDDLVHES